MQMKWLTFLNSKYKDKYLLWNIGTPESLLSPLWIPFQLPSNPVRPPQIPAPDPQKHFSISATP